MLNMRKHDAFANIAYYEADALRDILKATCILKASLKGKNNLVHCESLLVQMLFLPVWLTLIHARQQNQSKENIRRYDACANILYC